MIKCLSIILALAQFSLYAQEIPKLPVIEQFELLYRMYSDIRYENQTHLIISDRSHLQNEGKPSASFDFYDVSDSVNNEIDSIERSITATMKAMGVKMGSLLSKVSQAEATHDLAEERYRAELRRLLKRGKIQIIVGLVGHSQFELESLYREYRDSGYFDRWKLNYDLNVNIEFIRLSEFHAPSFIEMNTYSPKTYFQNLFYLFQGPNHEATRKAIDAGVEYALSDIKRRGGLYIDFEAQDRGLSENIFESKTEKIPVELNKIFIPELKLHLASLMLGKEFFIYQDQERLNDYYELFKDSPELRKIGPHAFLDEVNFMIEDSLRRRLPKLTDPLTPFDQQLGQRHIRGETSGSLLKARILEAQKPIDIEKIQNKLLREQKLNTLIMEKFHPYHAEKVRIRMK